MKTPKLRWFETEAGFTLIEVLIASILFSLIAVAFAASYINGNTMMANVSLRQQALALTQEGIDQTKTRTYLPLRIWISNNPLTSRYSHDPILMGGVIYSRNINVVNVSNNFTVAQPYNCNSAVCSCIRIDVSVYDAGAQPKFEPVFLNTVVCTTHSPWGKQMS